MQSLLEIIKHLIRSVIFFCIFLSRVLNLVKVKNYFVLSGFYGECCTFEQHSFLAVDLLKAHSLTKILFVVVLFLLTNWLCNRFNFGQFELVGFD